MKKTGTDFLEMKHCIKKPPPHLVNKNIVLTDMKEVNILGLNANPNTHTI